MPTVRRPHPLALALWLALPLAAGHALAADDAADGGAREGQAGDTTHAHDTPRTLDTVEVTASPLRNAVDALARPVDVLAGSELDDRKTGTLGETLAQQPGVQSSFFGAGVGRPIIRGQDGARVQVLSGGAGSLDVSTVSADHAVTIEPFLADQIEVLKGPATLLYGSGAIGGAVNVVDGRVPTLRAGRPLSGRMELRVGDGNDEETAMLRLDGDLGALTWHVDGFSRKTGDVDIPGYAFSSDLVAEELAEGEDPSELARGRLPNSALKTEGGAVGASWIGERGWLGAALSTYRSNYGIPPGAHAHEDDPMAPPGDEEELVRLDLRQDRVEARAGLRDLGWLEQAELRLTRSDYRHVELEGDAVGTRFDNEATEARLELVPRLGGGWRGAFGLQASDRDFSAVGDEAFVPPSVTRDLGVFALAERDFERVKLELGARHDRVRTDPEGGPRARHGASSLAIGGLWRAAEGLHLSLNLDRAQRAPSAEELFSDGPHVATQSYEIGDAGLDVETSRSVELGLHAHLDRFEGKLSLYHSRFDDFIYLADTGAELDELPVRAWTQADARFTGWEAEGTLELAEGESGLWSLRLFADQVRARLADGTPLPRIAPARVGAGLAWERGAWRAGLDATRVARQDDTAPGESATDGYTRLDARVAYHWDTEAAGWEAFLSARNLTDREARAHTSFLKDVAPLPGRNLSLGLRAWF